jgi:conjugal transfer pilus assembly protein TraI
MILKRSHPQALFEQLGSTLFQQLLTSSGAGEEGFRKNYLPPIEKLALTVQSLPLERGSFDHPGGALKFGLTAGLTTLRLSAGVIFVPTATAVQRMLLEPQYRWAAFVASLASVPLIVAHNVHVKIGDKSWTMASKQSTLWDASEATGEYEVSWSPPRPTKPSNSLGLVLLQGFFRRGMFSNIDPAVLLAMCEGINASGHQSPSESALAKIVRNGQEKVKEIEAQRRELFFEPPSLIPTKVTSTDDATTPETETPSTDETTNVLNPLEARTPGQRPKSTSHASTSPRDASETSSQVPIQIQQWARAVVANLPEEISFVDEGVRVSKAALTFGISYQRMYALIYEAGLVVSKQADGFIGTVALADVFRSEANAKL